MGGNAALKHGSRDKNFTGEGCWGELGELGDLGKLG